MSCLVEFSRKKNFFYKYIPIVSTIASIFKLDFFNDLIKLLSYVQAHCVLDTITHAI